MSHNNGKWLSVFQNEPTNPNTKLGFNVKIVGDDLSCDCRYENGKYLQDGEQIIVDGEIINGCTVRSGHSHVATFVPPGLVTFRLLTGACSIQVKVNSGEATYEFY